MRSHVVMILIIVMMLSSVPIYAVDSEAAADYTMNKAKLLSSDYINSVKSNVESEFGQKTVFRWDRYINPNGIIKCQNDGKLKKLNPQKMKRVISMYYSSADAASKNKYGVEIDPYLLYVISTREGFNLVLDDFYCDTVYESDVTPLWEGNGVSFLVAIYSGVRSFSGKAGIMKSGRFLRNNFRDDCYSAGFPSPVDCTAEEGMEMVSSVVAYYKWLFLKDAKILGIQTESLTEDEINFWTYYYYNRGSGKDTLQSLMNNGVFDDSQFIRAKPGEIIKNGCNARHNAIITTANSKFIRDLNVFAE